MPRQIRPENLEKIRQALTTEIDLYQLQVASVVTAFRTNKPKYARLLIEMSLADFKEIMESQLRDDELAGHRILKRYSYVR